VCEPSERRNNRRMLPTTAHSPPGRRPGPAAGALPPALAQSLAYVRTTPSAACGVGFVLALLVTRLFSGGGGGGGSGGNAQCLPPPPALPAASTTALHALSPPTAYIRLDQAVSTGTAVQPWRPGSTAGAAAVPASNGLLDLARLGEGGGVFTPDEPPRPRGAPALPSSPALSVVLPVISADVAAAAAATAAAAGAAGGTVEVVVVAADPAAAKAFFADVDTAGPALALRLLTRTGPALADHASLYAAALNDGVRAARGGLVVALAPGDRVGRGAWAALASGAAGHRDADVFYTGPAAVHRPDGGGGSGDEAEPLPAEAPWWSPVPPGAAFRKDRVWGAGGGFPAVPAPGRPARTAVEAGLWAAAAAAHGGTLAAVSAGSDALVSPAGGEEPAGLTLPPDLAAALAVSMSGAPLPPAAVLRAHSHVLGAARPGSPHREALAAAGTALAAATAVRGCPATAPVDLLLGLLHEAGGDARLGDASAAYARAAACADGAAVPALAWAARVRGDAVRAADLARCVLRAEAAAEPGSPPRPAAGNARADAAECVAVLGVAT
jgi:hypothetical protein